MIDDDDELDIIGDVLDLASSPTGFIVFLVVVALVIANHYVNEGPQPPQAGSAVPSTTDP